MRSLNVEKETFQERSKTEGDLLIEIRMRVNTGISMSCGNHIGKPKLWGGWFPVAAATVAPGLWLSISPN